jgi:hypothetical protein
MQLVAIETGVVMLSRLALFLGAEAEPVGLFFKVSR